MTDIKKRKINLISSLITILVIFIASILVFYYYNRKNNDEINSNYLRDDSSEVARVVSTDIQRV